MPRILDTASRTDDIVHAISGLVLEHGLEGVTFRNIARAVGISPGSLAHHYSTRARLLRVASYRFARAFVGDIASRRHGAGLLAFLPADADDLGPTRVWLAWCELGRGCEEIGHQLAEARQDERALLGRVFAEDPSDLWLDGALATVHGLREALCASVDPLSLQHARNVLTEQLGHRDPAPAPGQS